MTSQPPPHAAPPGAGPRVLLVSGEYPPTVGGVGDYTTLLATHLAAAGAAPSVLTGPAAGQPPCRPPHMTDAQRPTARAVPTRRDVPYWGVASWRAIDRAIAAERPDVVHLQYQAGAYGGRGAVNLLPWRLSRRAGAPPVVVTFHDLLPPYLFPKAGRLRAAAVRLLARTAAAVVATNGEDLRRLGADPRLAGRLSLIPIGSNIPADSPIPGDMSCAPPGERRPGEVLLAFFGLAGRSKGLATLLDALASLERDEPGAYRLVVVGGAPSATDRARFTDGADLAGALAARGLTGRVVVTGSLPAAAVAAHLRAADLAVLPYADGASWRRGSLLAALAAGLPVVTTTPAPGHDAGGRLPTLVDGRNALLVPPGNPAALAAAIGILGRDAGFRALIAAGARALAVHFAWPAIAARHLALYRDVLAARAGVAR
ncbi:MAG TPA: glycosyltransferase [Thermomicrobiales bacterium]|nr:glycosyltransferase [Thermomicrobiales bacterium]